jgi:hypothetical protein
MMGRTQLNLQKYDVFFFSEVLRGCSVAIKIIVMKNHRVWKDRRVFLC